MEDFRLEGLGYDLLTEWGNWMRNDSENRASWSVKPRVDRGYHGDPPDRVMWLDKHIAKHKLEYRSDWSVISRYFLSDLQIWQIAKGLRWPEGRVQAVLARMCGMVERDYLLRDLTN